MSNLALFEMFGLLCMGHFLADFGLQSDRMAVEKCPGRDVTLSWPWWLISHAAIHGFIVSMISGSILIGLLEWVFHVFIDYTKCRFHTSLGLDQALHLLTKAFWVVLLAHKY